MTNKLHIKYDSSRCIGAKKCIEMAPNFFSFNGEKAVLTNSKVIEGIQVLEVNPSSNQKYFFTKTAEHCPVNAIEVVDSATDDILVTNTVKTEQANIVQAEYNDAEEFVLDPEGYFLIRIDHNKKLIEVGFCNSRNIVSLKVTGAKPIDIYQTIINKENLSIRKDHCAYLGRELQKAYIALNKGITYVQDDELEL